MKTSFFYFKPNSIAFLLILCAGLITVSCKKNNDSNNNNNGGKLSFSSNFAKSSAEIQTSATGKLTGTFDPATMDLSYSFNWDNLTSKAVGMHIHDNGPVIIPIEGFPMEMTGTFSSTAKLTADQATDLKAGKLYVQIHTENFPAGEIIAPFTAASSNPGSNPQTPGGGGY